MKEYKSPTSLVWILSRTYCDGTSKDYDEVHAFQDGLSLVPLSFYGKEYTPLAGKVDPSIDMKTPIRDQVNRLDTVAYFQLLAKLLRHNPPAAADGPMLASMQRIGIVPGKDFDIAQLKPDVAKALQGVPKTGFDKIMAHFSKSGELKNGWTFSLKTGEYGTDYLQRAFITAVGLGANRPQDAVYPTAQVDSKGQPLEGKNRYVLRFAKDQLPPAKAFWSITMYDANYFFVPNSLDRYTLSSRTKFQTNKDGSVSLYLQHNSPGKELESNWLPAPDGKFILMMRMYWPEEAVLSGKWYAPSVQKQQ